MNTLPSAGANCFSVFSVFPCLRSPVPVGTVPIYEALERAGGRVENITWDLFKQVGVHEGKKSVGRQCQQQLLQLTATGKRCPPVLVSDAT